MSSPPFPETESRVSERINLFAEDVNKKQDEYVVRDDDDDEEMVYKPSR